MNIGSKALNDPVSLNGCESVLKIIFGSSPKCYFVAAYLGMKPSISKESSICLPSKMKKAGIPQSSHENAPRLFVRIPFESDTTSNTCFIQDSHQVYLHLQCLRGFQKGQHLMLSRQVVILGVYELKTRKSVGPRRSQ